MKSTSRACICLAVVVRQPGTSQSPPTQGEQGAAGAVSGGPISIPAHS